jgi:hypothetical protein
MHATLQHHGSAGDYYTCRIQHAYKKSRVLPTFLATIFRIRPGQVSPESHFPEIAQEAMTSEFVWYADERDFVVAPRASDYTVENLIVGSQRFNLTRNTLTDRIIFSCKLPYCTDELTYVSFEFEFPVEKQSALSLTAEFPSHRGSITFDYSKIKDELDVTPFPKLGIHRNQIDLSRPPDGVYKYEYGEWVLPKDGCVFAWWTKAHK